MQENDNQACETAVKIEDVLKEKRLILGFTQTQVAKKANTSLRSYQRFESGERNLLTSSFDTACQIIEALGMNISDFYHGEYSFGEEIYFSEEGLRYKKTGELVNKDLK